MAQAYFNPCDDPFTSSLISRKAKQLIGRAGFKEHDRGDLEQTLLKRVIESLSRFDPSVAHRNVFVTTVVERHVANILRNQRAAKRDPRRISSLNVVIRDADEGPVELVHTISVRELDARLGRERRSQEELDRLALDLADVIDTLPDAWRQLIELRKTRTMSEAAREMGVPRTTLNDWMRRIRRRFEDAGLRDYL